MPLSSPHFYVSHAGCFLLPAAPSVSPHMPCVTDVLATQKAALLGMMPDRLAPLPGWTPGGFRFTSDRIALYFQKSTTATAAKGLGPLLWG